ncbi:hypothetical protein [Fusobacterium massiliense]|jgi:hypothetical protein|uniref:hypothetical protein n=1 Tax=Fusobacterium massiliense TaxID=1852365 RepID=UPI00093FE329|nr:hypothetical protein [Fusobacterium massiliense]
MKKLLRVVLSLVLGVFFMGCFASNVDLGAKKVLVKEYKGLKMELSRSDLSGVFIDFQNLTNKDITIVWKESTLGGSKIMRHDAIVYPALNAEDTTLPELERRTFVIHRLEDFYYLDPVLYAKGGVRIKPLKYPVELKLVIQTNGQKETLSVFLDNNYESNENAKDERYAEDVYSKERKVTADVKDKDYHKNILNRRLKVDDLPEAKIGKEHKPVVDTLYINHKTGERY